MEFRQATESDLNFVKENSLYPIEEKEVAETDYVYTLDHGDYILGVGGFRMITGTTAWAWLELTDYVGGHLVPTYRVIKEYMEIFCRDHHIVRLQAWVRDGFMEGMRTVRNLDFEEEYLMKNFLGMGCHAILFVKYFKGV